MKNGVAGGGLVRVPVNFHLGGGPKPPQSVNPAWVAEISYVDPVQFAKLERAAEGGDVDAETSVGFILLAGIGVPRDVVKGTQWYEKAAEKGDSAAEFRLAMLYERGERVPRDVSKAMEWFEKASAHGDAMGDNNLGWILARGDGVPKDSFKAMEWYRKAAAKGNVLAYGNLGWMYEHGEGVPRDDVLAYAWLTIAANQGLDALAAAQGEEPETKDLPSLERTMSTEQISEAKRLSSSWVKGQLLTHETK